MRRLVHCFFAATLLVVANLVQGAEGGLLRRASVVVADDLWKVVRETKSRGWLAAQDLAMVLEKTTGTRPILVRESEFHPGVEPVIFVGPTKAADRAGLLGNDMRKLSFHVKSDGQVAYVASKSGVGTSYAVTEFLQLAVDYYFTMIDGNDPFVRDPNRTLPVFDRCHTPSIYTQRGYPNGWHLRELKDPVTAAAMAAYLRRVRGTVGPEGQEADSIEGEYLVSLSRAALEHHPGYHHAPTCHSTFYYVPPCVYAKEHPEYYSLAADGQRHFKANTMSQLCYTNPDVRRIVADGVVELAEAERKAHPGNWAKIFDLTQMDSCNFLCFCPDCRKIIDRYNAKKGGHAEGGDAALQMDFINDVARRVHARCPDVMLRVYAYVSTETPPADESLRFEDNVILQICDLYGFSCHCLPLTHPFNAARMKILDGWRARAKHFHIWDYIMWGGEYGSDLDLIVDAPCADAKVFRDLNVEYLFRQDLWVNQPFWEVSHFVMTQAYMDADVEPNRLVKIFCRCYGRGADAMERLINRFRMAIRDNPPASYADWFPAHVLPWNQSYSLIKDLIALGEEAYIAAETPLAKARVAKVLQALYHEWAPICRHTPGKMAEFERARMAFVRYAEEDFEFFPARAETRERLKVNARLEGELLKGVKFTDLPAELNDVPEADLFMFDWHRINVFDRVGEKFDAEAYARRKGPQRVKDPLSQCGVAAVVGAADGEPQQGAFWPVSKGGAHVMSEVVVPTSGFSDDKYRWVKFGTYEIGRNSKFCPERRSWIYVFLKGCYTDCDGLDYNPNRFEFWASIRYQGPKYISGDTRADAYFVDRVIMRRVR